MEEFSPAIGRIRITNSPTLTQNRSRLILFVMPRHPQGLASASPMTGLRLGISIRASVCSDVRTVSYYWIAFPDRGGYDNSASRSRIIRVLVLRHHCERRSSTVFNTERSRTHFSDVIEIANSTLLLDHDSSLDRYLAAPSVYLSPAVDPVLTRCRAKSPSTSSVDNRACHLPCTACGTRPRPERDCS